MTVTKAMGKVTVTKPSQVLTINPSTYLTFRGHYREVVNLDLALTNPTKHRVCFKVKTNYPDKYFVRPNGGLIEPGEQQVVSVMLQPLEHTEEELKLHKFMVQSIIAPDGPLNGLEKLWKETRQEDVMDTKIRCLFELTSQPISEELPRYRGRESLDEVDVAAPSVTSAPAKPDAKSEGHSMIFVVFVALIVFCLIIYGYVLSKQTK